MLMPGKSDEVVWNDFNNNWDDLAFESEKILTSFDGKDILKREPILKKISALWKVLKRKISKDKSKSELFRQTVCPHIIFLLHYGIDIPDLLIASHIIPWSRAEKID